MISVISEKVIAHSIFESLSLLVIISNSITIALQSPLEPDDPTLSDIETGFLVFYTIEMFLKIFAMGFVMNKSKGKNEYNFKIEKKHIIFKNMSKP